jgi:hypothetical protein
VSVENAALSEGVLITPLWMPAAMGGEMVERYLFARGAVRQASQAKITGRRVGRGSLQR